MIGVIAKYDHSQTSGGMTKISFSADLSHKYYVLKTRDLF